MHVITLKMQLGWERLQLGTVDFPSLMSVQTPKGQAKSIHISEVSTIVVKGKINGPGKRCPLRRTVHIVGVSTRGNSTVHISCI